MWNRARPPFQAAYGRREEFFLFSCVMDATMIDKRMSDKAIQFELSMGNAGNTLDGQIPTSKHDDTDSNVSEDLGEFSVFLLYLEVN